MIGAEAGLLHGAELEAPLGRAPLRLECEAAGTLCSVWVLEWASLSGPIIFMLRFKDRSVQRHVRVKGSRHCACVLCVRPPWGAPPPPGFEREPAGTLCGVGGLGC